MSAPSDACISAFERQYDTTWADPALRNERLSWIACWKAASACQGCAVQQGYMPAQAVVQIQEPERNKPSMSMHVSVEDYQRALADWEAEQSQLAAVQQGVQQTLIAELESIAQKYASAYEDAGRETYREDVEKQARKAKQDLTSALQSALATHPTQHGLNAAKFNRLELEIRGITKMLPEKFDCSGVWSALEAAQAKQVEQA